jgi:hypothetical protein
MAESPQPEKILATMKEHGHWKSPIRVHWLLDRDK